MIYISGKYGIHFSNNHGAYHRLDYPAVIDGKYKAWYQNGKYHRIDGPAFIIKDNLQVWYQNGKYHREDGPAYMGRYGEQYYIEGERYTEDEFYEKIKNL